MNAHVGRVDGRRGQAVPRTAVRVKRLQEEADRKVRRLQEEAGRRERKVMLERDAAQAQLEERR